MSKPRWLNLDALSRMTAGGLRRKSAEELPLQAPLHLGNHSSGEYFHASTPREQRIQQLVLQRSSQLAARLGLDRREFLASSMGMLTTLSVINSLSGCGTDGSGGGGGGSGGSGGAGGSGGSGGYTAPDSSTTDCDEADQLLDSSDWFIFDIQTHHVDLQGEWRQTNPGLAAILPSLFPQGSCTSEAEALACLGYDQYLDLVFRQSDTSMAVLSGFPTKSCDDVASGCGNPLGSDDIALSMQATNLLAKSERVINHCLVMPNDGLAAQLSKMERVHATYGVGGFKCYTSWGPSGVGYDLDDANLGIPVIQKAVDLGVPVICVHKGIPLATFDTDHNGPRDIPGAANAFPQVKFVIYHSNVQWNGGGLEGPYDSSKPFAEQRGVDALIHACQQGGLGPNQNVYPELGTAFFTHVGDPVAAAHLIGKLLLYFGEDNVLWGSECIWMGSPQPQIEAFRSLTISQQLQEQYGYPELTEARKRKILGLNAARVYGIDAEAQRCKIAGEKLALEKKWLDHELGPRRWALTKPLGPSSRREFLELARLNRALRQPG